MKEDIIMHIDVNSAFLSWQAAYELQMGMDRDLRKLPSVIGGSEESRHGIVLAKSTIAKKHGIQAGNSLMEARRMCPDLVIVRPNYDAYVKASKALIKYLKTITPYVEQFSIDECFIKLTDLSRDKSVEFADRIRENIREIFGYTVNVGISTNKLLAKMAGDFKKPDMTHTCFPEEVQNKMWPLPVSDLFMVGRRTSVKLNKLGINTIGDLANYNYSIISSVFKSHGRMIYNYAWGRDESVFRTSEPVKSIGNGSTIKFDVTDRETAHIILLSLVEKTAWRLREEKAMCNVISVGIKDKDFIYISRQHKLNYPTDCTQDIYEAICRLFDEMWDKKPIRQLSVSVTDLEFSNIRQINMLKSELSIKNEKLDKTIDSLRGRFGECSVIRGVFANSDFSPILGGYPKDDYVGMSSIL